MGIERIPDRVALLERCKCNLCQNEIKQIIEAKKMEKKNKKHTYLSEEKLQQRATDYEWMFLEQKEICAGYRKIIQEMEKEIKKLKLKK